MKALCVSVFLLFAVFESFRPDNRYHYGRYGQQHSYGEQRSRRNRNNQSPVIP